MDVKLIFDSYFRGSDIPPHIEQERHNICKSCVEYVTNLGVGRCGLCGCVSQYKVKNSASQCAYATRSDKPKPKWTRTKVESNGVEVYNSSIKETDPNKKVYNSINLNVEKTNVFKVTNYGTDYFRIGFGLLIKESELEDAVINIEKPDNVNIDLIDSYSDFYVSQDLKKEDFTITVSVDNIKKKKQTIKKEFKIYFKWETQ